MTDKNVILVCGGAGFIGSHLCERLINEGNSVVCIDNFLTGKPKNIEKLQSNPHFNFIEHDLIEPLTEKQLSDIARVSKIYHLASPASPLQYQNHPLETLLVNSVGTKNLLDLAKKLNARFLFTSTSEVYGDPKEHPQKESYWGNVNSYGVRSCYDEAKRFAEALLYTHFHTFHVDTRIVRIFNTYGPNMEKNDGRVISNFIMQALKNKPITMYGDGSQTRSFCYVSDMVDGLIRLMESDTMSGEIVNIGNPDERSIKEIAGMVQRLTESKSPINFQPLPPDDPTRRKPDCTKAREELGWNAKVGIEEGLQKTIEYFRNLQ